MTLEGPRPSTWDRVRSELLGGMSKPTQRALMSPMTSFLNVDWSTVPSATYVPLATTSRFTFGIVAALGAIAGGWLAGTTSGRNFVRRVRGK